MALRLAGEEYSVVRGLDGLGWPREVEANDADPGLKVTQSGSGLAIQVVSGDIDHNNNLLKNAKLGSALNLNSQDLTNLGELKTTNLLLKEGTAGRFYVRDAADSAYKAISVADVTLMTTAGFDTGVDGVTINALNTDGAYLGFTARDNGATRVEVARLQGAADPYLQATLPMVLNPSAQPGTLVEGHLWYDSTAKKLKFYNGTAVETVTSA